MPEDAALGVEERAELERLRAEVAALRSQVQAGGGAAGGLPGPPGRVGRQRWRTIVATLCIVVACVLAPLSAVAVWTRNQVTNTDRYVATVSPLARDPAIQAAIADQITAQVFTYIDIQGLTRQAVDALADRGLRPELASQLEAFAVPVANGVRSFTRDQVGRIVASDAFADAWVQANRAAHAELVRALTGEGGGAVRIENDTVSLNLAAFVQTVKAQLVASGFTLAARIPEVNTSFVLFQSADVTRVRSGFNLLNTLGVWLPVITLILLVIGVRREGPPPRRGRGRPGHRRGHGRVDPVRDVRADLQPRQRARPRRVLPSRGSWPSSGPNGPCWSWPASSPGSWFSRGSSTWPVR